MKSKLFGLVLGGWTLGRLSAHAQSFYYVSDLNVLQQTSSGTPSSYNGTFPGTEDSGPYSFEIQAPTDNYPTVTGPGSGSPYTLMVNGSGKYVYDSPGYATLNGSGGLTTDYPDGNYTFNNVSPETVNLASTTFPGLPYISGISTGNWSGGDLMITAGYDETLSFSPYTGATFSTSGVETLRIYGDNGNTTSLKYQQIGPLGGSYFSSQDIGTLSAGTYTAFLEYDDITSLTTPDSGADYFAATTGDQTYFTIVVAAPEPGIFWMLLLAGGMFLAVRRWMPALRPVR